MGTVPAGFPVRRQDGGAARRRLGGTPCPTTRIFMGTVPIVFLEELLVFVGTVPAGLADISDLGEIFICFDDLRLPWGQSPQVSQCAAKMAGLLDRRRLGGTPRPTSRSFLTVCTISLDGVGVLPSRRVWVPLTRGLGSPHGDFDSPCRASVFPCGGWRPSLRRLASSPVPGFEFPCTGV